MFAYEELKERLPETEEVMSGREAMNYFKAKKKSKKGIGWYTLAVNDIYSKTHFSKGAILDIGCGGGGLLKEFNGLHPELELVGIDASKTLLNAARKFVDSKKIKLIYSNAEKTGFKDNDFDLVVCQDTFHHFKNPVKVLREIYRITRKGGIIYLTDLRRDAEKELIENAIKNISRNSISHTMFYLASLKAAYIVPEIKQIVKKAGIKRYKIYNGVNDANTMKIILTISDKEKRLDRERLFKERWVAIIEK